MLGERRHPPMVTNLGLGRLEGNGWVDWSGLATSLAHLVVRFDQAHRPAVTAGREETAAVSRSKAKGSPGGGRRGV